MMTSDSLDYLIVAAIDFGTTFSGYAFATRNDFQKNPPIITSPVWNAGSGYLLSPKTSSCALFNPAGEFHSFGFEAENKYSELGEDESNQQQDWYFFRHFKMALYLEKTLNRNFELVAHNNKKMPGLKVITACIRYLKERLLEKCRDQGYDVCDRDIRWVITVPAIWTEPAKQFMREAAKQAGLPVGNQLLLSLEPEAASLWCKQVEKKDANDSTFSTFGEKSRYMVVDAGGGTLDITVHEVKADGTLKELQKANGGNWGGTAVDQEFEKFISEIIGEDAFQDFMTNNVEDMIILQRNFEVAKRLIEPCSTGIKCLSVPCSLLECFKAFNKDTDVMSPIQLNPKYTGKVRWKRDKLIIDADIFISFFKQSLTHISTHVSQLLQNPESRGINAIIMVGGYSESKMLQGAIKNISDGKRVIVPNDAGLVVLKGAVINGFSPAAITERVCRYTYGISVRGHFIEGIHKEEYAVTSVRGNKRCENLFQVHAKIGDVVNMEEPSKPRMRKVQKPNQTKIKLAVCASTSESPMYVTDKDCTTLGEYIIHLPDTSQGLKRGARVSMIFGGPEIQVIAIDVNTEKKQVAYFNFLD